MHDYLGGAVHGILQINKAFYSIEFVDLGLHVFKTMKSYGAELERFHLPSPKPHIETSAPLMVSLSPPNSSLYAESRQVTTATVNVDIFIKFYFTEKFQTVTTNVNGFIDKLISKLNVDLEVGYSVLGNSEQLYV